MSRCGAVLLTAALLCATLPGFATSSPEEFHNYLEKYRTPEMDIELDSHVQLWYNASTFNRSGEWVEVSFAGVAHPHRMDIVALFAPADAYERGSAPVKYEFADQSPEYLGTGSGRLRFRLVNLRQDMRFVMVRHPYTRPVVFAKGPELWNADPNELTGIHLMPGHRPVDMLVQWTSKNGTLPFVRFGYRPGKLIFSIPATTETYTRAQLCGAPANAEGWIDPGQLHTAVLSGLTPETRYYYAVGTGLGTHLERLSEVHSFLSHPGVGPDLSVSVLAVADQGVGEPDGARAAMEYQPALRVARSMEADFRRGHPGLDGAKPRGYRMVLHNGDISYARGYGALWDTFLFQQRELMTRVPVVTSIANHERDWPGQAFYFTSADSGGECGVPYYARFPMPRPNLAPDQAFYSFDFGPAHVAVMSTEHDYTPGSDQHLWLSGDLAAVDRSRTPWLILMGHRPMYIDANDFDYPGGKQTTAIEMRTALEVLLRLHRVDLVLTGHHHSYQRTCAVHLNRCVRPHAHEHRSTHGTVHVTFGHGGADLTANGFDRTPRWIKFEDFSTHGHVRLHMNGSHLHLQAIESEQGAVFDEVMLVHKKKKHGHGKGGGAGGGDGVWSNGVDDAQQQSSSDSQDADSANDYDNYDLVEMTSKRSGGQTFWVEDEAADQTVAVDSATLLPQDAMQDPLAHFSTQESALRTSLRVERPLLRDSA